LYFASPTKTHRRPSQSDRSGSGRTAGGAGAAAVRAHHVAALPVHLANLWGQAAERKCCTAGGCCEAEAFHR
jgi:hypothetical protein